MSSIKNLPSTSGLEQKINEIFTVPFFSSKNTFTRKQEEYALIQYYYYVVAFPDFLVEVLNKCRTDEERLPLIKNLWEEHGDGDLSRSHRMLYRGLLNSLMPEEIWSCIKPGEAVQKAIKETHFYLKGAGLNEALVFLGHGIEFVTPGLYQKLMEKIELFKDARVNGTFFIQHIQDDEDHYLSLTAQATFVPLAFERALEIEKNFWTNLATEMERIHE